MKGMTKAILFGGFILATQAAMAADVSAFPGAMDDGIVGVPPRVTPQPASAQTANVQTPTQSDEAGSRLPVRATYADTHPVNWDSVSKQHSSDSAN